MESGFDFSQLKIVWGVVFAIFIIFKFFFQTNAKQQASSADELEPDQREGKSIEEILHQMTMVEEEEHQPKPQRAKPRNKQTIRKEQEEVGSKFHQVKTQRQKPVYGGTPSNQTDEPSPQSNGVADNQAHVEFDLREAVIMSEILTRKYED